MRNLDLVRGGQPEHEEIAMTANEGSMDRAVRMSLGVAFMALGLSGVVAGVMGVSLVAIGSVLLVTGTVGRCPVYSWFGWDTHARR
jgi:hypothetical protein